MPRIRRIARNSLQALLLPILAIGMPVSALAFPHLLLTLQPGYAFAVLRDKPKAYWRFDEAGGSIAHDAASGRLNGRYIGGPTLKTPSGLGDGLMASTNTSPPTTCKTLSRRTP